MKVRMDAFSVISHVEPYGALQGHEDVVYGALIPRFVGEASEWCEGFF